MQPQSRCFQESNRTSAESDIVLIISPLGQSQNSIKTNRMSEDRYMIVKEEIKKSVLNDDLTQSHWTSWGKRCFFVAQWYTTTSSRVPSGMPSHSVMVAWIYPHSVSGSRFSVESCPRGAFPIIRPNEIRDPTASVLTEVCDDVRVERNLQPITRQCLQPLPRHQMEPNWTWQWTDFGVDVLRELCWCLCV